MASAASAKGRRPRKAKKSASRGGLIPWVLALGGVSAAIAAYDHSTFIRQTLNKGVGELPSIQSLTGSDKENSTSAAVHPTPRPEPPMAKAVGDDLIGKSYSGTFYYCGRSGLDNCVVEGNLFWHKKQPIRLADISVPMSESAKCPAERERGFAAKVRLRELLNQGSFELVDWPNRDSDKDGKRLRVVMRNGRSIGAELIREGLARPISEASKPWC
ncbi:thermonuclease family protein [Rhizobium oryzicola]|uniref:Thermonuclease family protein n=1 Tax=Rhizobium oryzicola TaxID=1232668 RepID=A0ABT8T175_9HYPH|nr:thermonuclease family protein [Rhizobium oryzicola]MDO1584398.1 thermonuclease family protein [Rhizobium oryzicola]